MRFAFSGMFCEVMLEVTKWYEDGSQPVTNPKQLNDSGPYMRWDAYFMQFLVLFVTYVCVVLQS